MLSGTFSAGQVSRGQPWIGAKNDTIAVDCPRQLTKMVLAEREFNMDEQLEIEAESGSGSRLTVSGCLRRPPSAGSLFLFAHGAGAGMKHASMEAVAEELARRGVATLRYQFPYMEKGSRRPDRPELLQATVRAANLKAAELAPDLPRIAGGRSMGGRMTTGAQAQEPLPGVRSLALFAFPLHPSGKPATTRADHLQQIDIPMLFLSGDRDKLADLELFEPVCETLGPIATLHVLAGADHSFHVLKRSGRTDEEVMKEAGNAFETWAAGLG